MIPVFRLFRCKHHHYFLNLKSLSLFFFLAPSVLQAQYFVDVGTGTVFDREKVPAGRWLAGPDGAIAGSFAQHHGYYGQEADSLVPVEITRTSGTVMRVKGNGAAWGDVVVNEVMCDPVPPVHLPGCEYLEIFNRSAFPLDLDGWRVEINDRSYRIGGLKLGPGEYGVLGGPGGDALHVPGYLSLFSSGAALSNEGATVALYGADGTLVHVTRYAHPGNGPEWKRQGGWSLESADPDRPCNTSGLWEYATDDRGGTPGEKNSIYVPGTDRQPPRFMYMGYSGKGSITLYFSELIRILPERVNRARLLPAGDHPDSITMGKPFFDHLTLHFPGDLPRGPGARLLLPSVSDCSGNASPVMKIPVGQVTAPRFSSIQVNEIMYDPQEGAPEFIELYNPGTLFFDLQEVCLDVEEQGAPIRRLVPLIEGSRILSPGEFVVLSGDTNSLVRAYGLDDSGTWTELKSMPAMSNKGGTIYLADRSGNVIEMVHYDDGMHMDLLDDTKGISLERISPARPGTDPGNWHSAASIEGYATPGKKNSQSPAEGDAGSGLSVEPKVFSPDQDGYEDLLQVSFAVEGQGWVIRLWVTDLKGCVVRRLAVNHVAGPVSTYTWDGEQDDGGMAGEGIYVIHLRGYHPVSKKRFQRKAAAGLIYR
jgi:hypothetical protein